MLVTGALRVATMPWRGALARNLFVEMSAGGLGA
jgi:hypothetical protein